MEKGTVNSGLVVFKFLLVLTLATNAFVYCQTQHSELSITRNETRTVLIDLLSRIGNNCQIALHISVNPKAPATENDSTRKSGRILFEITDPNTESQVTFEVKIDYEQMGQKKKLQEVCFDSCKTIKALDLKVTSFITSETILSIEAIQGRGTCEINHEQEIIFFIVFIISFPIAIVVGIILCIVIAKPSMSNMITWWLKTFLKQYPTYERTKGTKTVNSISEDEEPLLLEVEIKKCSILRWLSIGLCVLLLLNGLQMLVIGFNTQDSTVCPAEPLLSSFQIKVGTWLCLATVMRVAATMLCYFIFTEIYYQKNHNFSRGRCFYFIGHSILFLFDCANFGIFMFFSTIYIKMFRDTLKPEDVGLSVEDPNCDKGLYTSALLGFIILSILVWSAIVMLVIHIATIIKIFKRYRRGEATIMNGVELECLNNLEKS